MALSAQDLKHLEDGNLDLIDLDALGTNPDEEQQQVVEATPSAVDEEHKEAAPDDEEEVTYRREIDLGDGSGVQVFQASSPEELINKLVDAQVNATRKIREQAAELKDSKARAAAEKKADEEDEFVLSQEILSRPTDAVAKAFKKATGVDITEFKTIAARVQALDAAEQQKSEIEAQTKSANEFVAAHPEYIANPANAKRLTRAVDLLVAEAKASGQKLNYGDLIEKAYHDLSESGLLQLKSSDDVTDAKSNPTGAAKSRIETPEAVVTPNRQQTRQASSLANRSRNVTAPTAKQLSYDELLDQLDGMSAAEVRNLAPRPGR